MYRLMVFILSLMATAAASADAYCQGYRQGYAAGYAGAAQMPGMSVGVPTCPENPGVAADGAFAAGGSAGLRDGGNDYQYWRFRVTSPQGNSTRTLDDPRRASPSANVYSTRTPNAQKANRDY